MRTSTRLRTALIATLAGAAMIAAACSPAPAASKPLNPLTLGTNFVVGNGSVTSASISYDGTWTAFTSTSTNLVPADTNGVIDLFLRQLVLLVAGVVHENELFPLLVEELCLDRGDVGGIERVAALVGPVEHRAAEEVAELALVERLPLPRLHEIALDHQVGVPIDLDLEPLLELARVVACHCFDAPGR